MTMKKSVTYKYRRSYPHVASLSTQSANYRPPLTPLPAGKRPLSPPNQIIGTGPATPQSPKAPMPAQQNHHSKHRAQPQPIYHNLADTQLLKAPASINSHTWTWTSQITAQ